MSATSETSGFGAKCLSDVADMHVRHVRNAILGPKCHFDVLLAIRFLLIQCLWQGGVSSKLIFSSSFFFFGLQAGVPVDAESLSRQVWACLLLSCASRSHIQTLAFVLLSDAVGV